MKYTDGHGRNSYPSQDKILDKIQEFLKSDIDVLVISAPVATGKSFIAKVSSTFGMHTNIVTPQNTLIEQYIKDYPEFNKVMGVKNYSCQIYEGESCSIGRKNDCVCAGCPYTNSRKNTNKQTSVYNVATAIMISKENKFDGLTIIDEAHLLPDIVRGFCSANFSLSDYVKKTKTKNVDYFNVHKFIKLETTKLNQHIKELKSKKVENSEELEQMEQLLSNYSNINYLLEYHSSDYVIEKNEIKNKIEMFPILAPQWLMKGFLGKKTILMSGTMFAPDIKEIVGTRSFEKIEIDSNIPKLNRQFVYTPIMERIKQGNEDKYVPEMANKIKKIKMNHEKDNVVCHVTYNNSEKLFQAFPTHLFNTKTDKSLMLDEFVNQVDGKQILFAAGMAEGIDLKEDKCRAQIITKIAYPNLGDTFVKYRKALKDGELWYACQTLKTVIQQYGRSTRTPSDFSTTYIIDPAFGIFIIGCKRFGIVPKYFEEAIVKKEI